jgi:hypothetical protein
MISRHFYTSVFHLEQQHQQHLHIINISVSVPSSVECKSNSIWALCFAQLMGPETTLSFRTAPDWQLPPQSTNPNSLVLKALAAKAAAMTAAQLCCCCSCSGRTGGC